MRKTTLGSRIVAEHGRECSVTERFRKALAQGFASTSVVAESMHALETRPEYDNSLVILPKKATDDVFEQANSLLFHQLVDHIAKDGTDSIETFIRLANVR